MRKLTVTLLTDIAGKPYVKIEEVVIEEGDDNWTRPTIDTTIWTDEIEVKDYRK